MASSKSVLDSESELLASPPPLQLSARDCDTFPPLSPVSAVTRAFVAVTAELDTMRTRLVESEAGLAASRAALAAAAAVAVQHDIALGDLRRELSDSRSRVIALVIEQGTAESLVTSLRRETARERASSLAAARVASSSVDEIRAQLAEAHRVAAQPFCARCSSFELPPPAEAGEGPWLCARAARALIADAPPLRLSVIAPTVRVTIAGGGEQLAQLPQLLPPLPLSGVRATLQECVLPRYAAVFTLPRLRAAAVQSSPSAEAWLGGPAEEADEKAWLDALVLRLEGDVLEALSATGHFAASL